MTLAKVHCPISPIDPRKLDWYLANGWFRMGQTIFTTHILHYGQKFYSAIWLRVSLEKLPESKTFKRLQKINNHFRIEIQTASITKEKEELFNLYKTFVPFEASASLESLLYGKLFPLNIYQTMEVCLYDQNRLIATGFFDMGKEGAAGISCFYDPLYKKHSPGKYLIYLKQEYCRLLGLQYFYPGYFVPGYSMFDYKLEIGKSALEYYSLYEKEWFPMEKFSFVKAPLEEMREKLTVLKNLLSQYRMHTILFYYEFYNANLAPEFKGLELFDFPIFLHCFQPDENVVNPIIVYDIRDRQYHLIFCLSLCQTDDLIVEGYNYATHLLNINQYLFSTGDAEEMARYLKKTETEFKEGRYWDQWDN